MSAMSFQFWIFHEKKKKNDFSMDSNMDLGLIIGNEFTKSNCKMSYENFFRWNHW